MDRQANKPEAKIQYGAISASIWARTGTRRDGTTFETKQVSLDKGVRMSDGKWKHVHNFDINDLPKAVLALEEAYKQILTVPATNGANGAADVEEEKVE